MLKQILFLAGCAFVLFGTRAAHGYDLAPYKKAQAKRAIRFMLENVSPEGAAPGTIIASPSKLKPNYFRHWVRDGALIANVIVSLWEHAQTNEDRVRFEKMLWDFVLRSSQHQALIFHPVFDENGEPVNEEWGRPQNDGPALRAITLMRFAHDLRNIGRGDEAREKLFKIINTDLNGILYFGDYGYDIWEEVRGFHFYTRMVHRKALVMGKYFAEMNGDTELAEKCQKRVKELEFSLDEHWSKDLGYIEASLGIDGGMISKTKHLDIQVILGVLHGGTGDDVFPTHDYRVLKTVMALEALFTELYPINADCNGTPLIGRYEQCNWNGFTRGKKGNPWVLATEAFGEYYDRLSIDLERRGYIDFNSNTSAFYIGLVPDLALMNFATDRIEKERDAWAFGAIITALHGKADGYYKKVLKYVGPEGEFHEQILQEAPGEPTGPQRLGWSCAATIVGHWQRMGRVAESTFN